MRGTLGQMQENSLKLSHIHVRLNFDANKKKTIVKRGIETRQGSLILVLLKGIVDPAYEHLT